MITPITYECPIRELTGFDRIVIEDNMRKLQYQVREYKQYDDGTFVQVTGWQTVKEVRV